MKSLMELYKIGVGPSSSHTMGPEKASRLISFIYKSVATKYEVILYGSLALTGKGHGTDKVIKEVLGKDTIITFDTKTKNLPHPNTMEFIIFKNEKIIKKVKVLSIGGGEIKFVGQKTTKKDEVYEFNSFEEIKNYCKKNRKRIYEYAFEKDENLKPYLFKVYNQMKTTIEEGLKKSGVLPGGLKVQRKAKMLYLQNYVNETVQTRENRIISAYAFAVAEENACHGTVVTAPTCGACGVLPAVLYYMQNENKFTDEQIVNALATAGMIGNLIKTNASISGAECGCQAEIGSACAMASAGLAELFNMDIEQIEYASEVAIEHHLGLTCDPVKGLVQIPCIERNAVAAMRAINALSLANFLTFTRKVSLDTVIATMYATGKDLASIYKETSKGGLAKYYTKK